MTSEKQGREEKRVGVYICHCGGNISDQVDVARLAENVKDLEGVAVSHTNAFMCSDPGQELIQEDIKSGKINRVVVASCAPSLHEITFRGAIKRARMNPYLYEHANIREQVSWVHHGEKATDKATALVAAAIAKARELEPLEPVRVEARNHATVIGGGVAGMRAALDLSRRGIRVTLIEKTPFLGGHTAKLTTLYPTGAGADSVVRTLAEAVDHDDRIDVLTCTEVTGFEGYVGNFGLTLKANPPQDCATEIAAGTYAALCGYRPHSSFKKEREYTIQTGTVIMATGFRPYTPGHGEYGFMKQPEVMTLPEFIEETSKGPSKAQALTIKGRTIKRVAFIHCVGSRQIPGIDEPAADGSLNEYCSRTCCSAVLRTAVEIRQRYPRTHVLDYYRDIRTYGRGQEAYYEKASENNVLFFRFEPDSPPVVESISGGPHPLRIRVKDTLTFGEELSADVDLVVLAVGMEAQPIPSLVEMMKLPTGMDRFLQEVHPKLRPVEVANTGILLAGTCQAPMDIGEACAAAQASAAKAATLLGKGFVELDPYVAEVKDNMCSGHGNCKAVCPVEGAVTIADKVARINPALCTGCGICVSECPEGAIDIKGWTLKQYEEMVDAIVAA
ncbi:MAG: CoB--CoM heterodisulfide reductase iron-sulfur subunit A family protein [Desulfobacteraceae bacterium]|jgi:heterodisulfide reductase subunit A